MSRVYYDDDYELKVNKVVVRKNLLTKQQIESIAKDLVLAKVDNSNIFGYIKQDRDKNRIYCKWNKKNEVFVEYTADNDILLSKVKSFREYNGDKAVEYFDEI